MAESLDENAHDLVAELRTQLNERTFTDLASDLGYPYYAQASDDPVRLLARLNLPIYVTTSYYDFMERALRAEGREPHTEICFWHPDMAPDRPKSDFIPSPEKPVVYHLHGYEEEPITLVLSEDDYLDFLMGIAQDTDVVSRVIPLYLRTALAQSTLLLLGYRIQDWDFRTLFRGLITAKTSPLRDFSLALQLKLSEQEGVTDPDEAQKYLEEYFRSTKFNVIWNDADSFVHELWQRWNQWRLG
jgi:hypothetical protein